MPEEFSSLEALVKARTSEMKDTNAALQEEIQRRKEMEEELRRSWEYFRLIVEAAPVGVVMVNQEGRITLVNDEGCAIFGYTFEELVGQNLEILVPERARRGHKAMVEGFFAEAGARRIGRGREVPGVRRDGREILLEIDLTLLRVEAGTFAMASIVDITERRENQQNMQRLAAIVQASDDAIISETLDGTVTSWNPGAARLFLYSAEEMVGQPTSLLLPPGRLMEEIEILTRVGQGNWVDHFETVRKRKDGVLIDVSVTVSPMRDSKGRVVGAAKIARDITDRKLAMTALKELNEALELRVEDRTQQLTKAEARARSQAQLLEAVFHSMAEGVAVADASGQLTHFNPAAEELLGPGLREMNPTDRGYEAFRPDGTTPYPRKDLPLARALRGETPEPMEVFVRHEGNPDGGLLSVSARPINDTAGNVRGAVAVFHDITERKKAEAMVTASLREKEAMLREIHHRVKNNMQIISSILRLQGHYIKDPALNEVFKDCQGRIRTMALIHEMLYQSKGLARIDFKVYLQNLAGLLLRSQTNKSLVLRHQFDIEPLELTMDVAIPVGLIANELLTNCLKHAFTGRENGLVRVALTEREDGTIVLTIADDGRGLPVEFAPEKSASLGLRLVKILTDQIKGKLDWRGSEGAEFILTFRDRESPANAPQHFMSDHAVKPKILVVEDEAIVSADIQDHLTGFGYQLAGSTDSGEESIRLARQLKPDLVLMDIILSGAMDGTMAAKQIREELKIPVVFLTANSDDVTVFRARDTDPFGYVLKPFEDRSLRIAIEMALYKHRVEREREELIKKLQAALEHVKTLQGMLPICAWCKKVRDDEGYWMTVDQYLRTHSELEFSHGVCPTCAAGMSGPDALRDKLRG